MSDPISPAALNSLPDHPDLAHLRGQARSLLESLRAFDPVAVERAKRALPHRREPWQLADAQAVVAREYGFASWPKLATHVEATRASTDARERTTNAFKAAVETGDVAELTALFERDPATQALVNAPIFNFGGRAASRVKGNAALLDLLIANGADLNLKSDWWAGPWGVLETASAGEAEMYLSRGATIDVFAAAHLDRLDLLRSMLDSDPSLAHARGGDGCRPLHFARSPAAMDLLLSHGAEIDARDVDHESTALQWALPRPPIASHGGVRPEGSLDRCRWLAERGATVDIFAAAAMDDVALVRRALEAYPSARDAHVNAPGYPLCPVAPGGHIYAYTLGGGMTPYAVAAAFGSRAAMAALTEHTSAKQQFLAACTTGQAETARRLLQEDRSLPQSLTATEQAALPHAAWNGNAAAVVLMLDVGFDALATGPDGGTALHCAAWRGLADLVEQVITHPRVESVRDRLIAMKDTSHGSTPLGWCCHGSAHCRNPDGDYPRIARTLLAAGAKVGPNLKDATPEVRATLALPN